MDTLIIPSSVKFVQDSAFVNDYKQIIIHNKGLNLKFDGSNLETHIQCYTKATQIGSRNISPILTNSLNEIISAFPGIICVPDLCHLYDCMVYGISKGIKQQYVDNDKYISVAAKWIGRDEISYALKANHFIVLDYSKKGLAKYGYKDLANRLLIYQTIINGKTQPDFEKISLFLKSKAVKLTGNLEICYNYLIEGKKDISEYLRTEGIPLEEGAEIIDKMLGELRLTEEEKQLLNIQ